MEPSGAAGPLLVRTKPESLTPEPYGTGSPTSFSPTEDKLANETFVYKLYRMVEDPAWQHLITWNFNGTAFIVIDAIDFARDVLPKYFKHNNFSSYVRQLNMYGFHKVNDSPRSPKPNNEPQMPQIWEFSHPKFWRGHPELLPEIKRKIGVAMSPVPPYNRSPSPSYLEDGASHAETMRSQQTAIMASIQSELMKQVQELQNNFHSVLRELSDTKHRLEQCQTASVRLVQIVSRQQELLGPEYQTFDPTEFAFLHEESRRLETSSPSIFVSAMPEFNVNVTDFSMLAAPPPPTELAHATRSISADGVMGLSGGTSALNAQPSSMRHGFQPLTQTNSNPGPIRTHRATNTLQATQAGPYEYQATLHRRTHSFNQETLSQQNSMDSDTLGTDSVSGTDDLMLESSGRHDHWSTY